MQLSPVATRARSADLWAQRTATHLGAVERRLAAVLADLGPLWHNQVGAGLSGGPEPVEELRRLLAGGKHTRPRMVLLGWAAADLAGTGLGGPDAVTASAAIELLHCFALLQDDVMDRSPVRRGRPAVHEDAARAHRRRGDRGDSTRFGDNVAVLVGDLAHAEADRLAGTLTAPMRREWRVMVVELLAGQLGDLTAAAAGTRVGAPERAWQVARQKTGGYTVGRPLRLGALAAGAGPTALSALAEYGDRAGEAFALRDDLLGAFGDPAVTGKPVGEDIRAGKPTVLLALAAEDDELRPLLADLGTSAVTDRQVRGIQDALRQRGVVDHVEALIDARIHAAVAALDVGVADRAIRPDAAAELTRVAGLLGRREV